MKALITLPKNGNFPRFFTDENIALANSLGEMIWNEKERQLTVDEIVARVGDCDAYITGWGSPALDRTILDAAPDLRLLVHLCGSVAGYAGDAVWERGVRVICGNDFFAESVAEGTVGYMLSALRDIPKYSTALSERGEWKRGGVYTKSLLGKTVGVVSYGAVARYLVRMLQPFRVKIKVYDIAPLPPADVAQYGLQQASLAEVFSTSDIITVHTPLLEQTYHLIDEKLLKLIPDGALLVNTSRGAIIDQAALERELLTGRFQAALDVYEQEPITKESPLTGLKNALLMPHMAGPTTDLMQVITRNLLQESADYLDRGAPLRHEITRERTAMMTVNQSELIKKMKGRS